MFRIGNETWDNIEAAAKDLNGYYARQEKPLVFQVGGVRVPKALRDRAEVIKLMTGITFADQVRLGLARVIS